MVTQYQSCVGAGDNLCGYSVHLSEDCVLAVAVETGVETAAVLGLAGGRVLHY